MADAIQGPNATKCTTLRVSGAWGWEPVTYLDGQNVARGVAIDILQEFARQNRIELEVNLDIPWTRAMLMLANGEIDAMAGAYFTEERDKEFLYSLPFASDDIMVFQNADHTFVVNETRDLINHRGARPQGGSYGDFLDHYAADYLDIIFSPTGNRIMDLLTSHRVDYVMLGRYDGLANIANDHISREIHMVERPLVANPVMFMFSRKSPCMKMVPKLDTFIHHLDETGRLTKMTETHLPAPPQN
ncbi:amino acid-binding protein [Thalassospira mesophila]|uniref:Amino acid-binding protein n=1 Tax=Thalassospira mesophila TaxID=1293891 RepID=A0A1Y2KYF7_9PROT|nr:amino acid-binding protein [Thalassospira mesophila]